MVDTEQINNNVLYKYYADNTYNRCALDNNYIWASHPLNFNDPYDCALHFELTNLKTELPQNTIDALNKYINEKAIICFSEVYNSILMWSHYADSHKGFCIAYKKDYFQQYHAKKSGNRLKNINYTHSINIDAKGMLEDKLWCEVEKLLTTKYADWSYEREWRFLLEYTEERDKTIGGRKFKLEEGLENIIDEIILGVKCPEKTEYWLKTIFPNTKFKKLKMKSDSFELY